MKIDIKSEVLLCMGAVFQEAMDETQDPSEEAVLRRIASKCKEVYREENDGSLDEWPLTKSEWEALANRYAQGKK